jgi:hypothetical protein
MLARTMVYQPKHQITFGAICDKWREMILPQHKQSSQPTEKSHLKKLKLAFGSVPVAKLSLEMIQGW